MKYYISIIALVIIFSSATVAGAASTTTSTSSKDTQLKRLKVEQHIKDLQATSTVCTNLTSRIDKRLSNFQSILGKHDANYAEHLSKLQTISTKLQTDGEDVSKFNSDIAILQVKIDKFNTDKTAVETALTNTKQYSCGTSQGQFKSAFEAVKSAQTLVKADAMDISDFIRNTLRGDVIGLQQVYKAKHTK